MAWTRCPDAPWCRPAQDAGAGHRLAGMVLPLQPLSDTCVPEGVFLVDAVVQAPPPVLSNTGAVVGSGDRLRWTIDLFERLEQRERVRP